MARTSRPVLTFRGGRGVGGVAAATAMMPEFRALSVVPAQSARSRGAMRRGGGFLLAGATIGTTADLASGAFVD